MAAPTRRRRAATRTDRLTSFGHDGLTFDVWDDGPPSGEPVVLLHGWPGNARTWDGVAPLLHEAGLRTLAPDQRGYAPGARPTSPSSYGMDALAGDVLALLDAAGFDQAHLVGHDWGGAVAWHLAASAPERLRTVTIFSTPHPAAMAESLLVSSQLLRSAYIGAFQVPVLPEHLLAAGQGQILAAILRRSGLDAEHARAYARRMSSPQAVSASLAWYRALLHTRPRPTGPAQVPTTYVWSSGDQALGRRAAEATGRHVRAEYRFIVLDDVPHWIPEVAPTRAAALILDQVAPAPSTCIGDAPLCER